MKIATWNIERLKHHAQLDSIIDLINEQQADIFILTETDSRVQSSNYKHTITTPPLHQLRPGYYKPTENRITIQTNYEIIGQHPTYDPYTSLCVELKTPAGNMIVYGTIIGIYGNRHTSFMEDLSHQIADIDRLSVHQNFCLAGDYNLSFGDNYYFTTAGRNDIETCFEKNNLNLLTRYEAKCIDHIAISDSITRRYRVAVDEWNQSKDLSDHKGIYVSLSPLA